MEEADVKSLAATMGKKAANIGMKDNRLKLLRSALRGRDESLVAVEGIWLNTKALAYRTQIEALYVCPVMIRTFEAVDLLSSLIGRVVHGVHIVSEGVYHRLSEPKSDEGVISLCRLPKISLDEIRLRDKDLVLILDGLESPGNVGTIIRTAEAAGVCAVFISHGKTSVTNPRTVRSSLSSVLSLPVIEVEMKDVQCWLDKNGFTLYFADGTGGSTYNNVVYAPRSAMVVGNEKYGISPEWYRVNHLSVHIPMMGTVGSLNAGVAASILAYRVRSQFGFTSHS